MAEKKKKFKIEAEMIIPDKFGEDVEKEDIENLEGEVIFVKSGKLENICFGRITKTIIE